MARNITLFIIAITFIYSCATSKPKDFSLTYNKKNTGLENSININGCHVFQRECDEDFFSVIMFYPDGLFTIATTSNISPVIDCLSNDDESAICQYSSWGIYSLHNDTIKTQSIRIEGVASCTIFRNYIIQTNKSLINISDYVYPENTKIGYMKNYPSFRENLCKKESVFYPLKTKRSSSFCPFLKAKWFNRNK